MKLKEKILGGIKGGKLTFKSTKAMCDALGVKYSDRDKVKKFLPSLKRAAKLLRTDRAAMPRPDSWGRSAARFRAMSAALPLSFPTIRRRTTAIILYPAARSTAP